MVIIAILVIGTIYCKYRHTESKNRYRDYDRVKEVKNILYKGVKKNDRV
jgi:hypothetical protein